MDWKMKKAEPLLVSLYKKNFKISSAMARVLLNRKLDVETALKLMNMPEDLFENPRRVFGAELSAQTIISNLFKNKKFYIYADYDVDGMTSGFIITNYLRSLGEEVEVYLPERSDGYGLNMNYCKKIVEQNRDKNSVVITVDNGITKIDEIKYLTENEIPVVVTDHHEPQKVLPNCTLCDPFLSEDSAGKHLCGAGVIWKVIWIIDEIFRGQNFKFPESYLSPKKYLPYVAIGTIGDVMPFTRENLAIMKIGLEMIRNSEVHSLDVLFKEGIFGSHRVNSKNIIFGLNSMMNACSRMGQIWHACNLFFMNGDNEDKIYACGQEMKRLNEKRKTESKKATEYILSKYYPKSDDKIIVADIGEFTAGISGLVATNLMRQFNLPVCIYKAGSTKAAASARSVEGLNILSTWRKKKLRATSKVMAVMHNLAEYNFAVIRFQTLSAI